TTQESDLCIERVGYQRSGLVHLLQIVSVCHHRYARYSSAFAQNQKAPSQSMENYFRSLAYSNPSRAHVLPLLFPSNPPTVPDQRSAPHYSEASPSTINPFHLPHLRRAQRSSHFSSVSRFCRYRYRSQNPVFQQLANYASMPFA